VVVVLEYIWRAGTLVFECLQLPEQSSVDGMMVDRGLVCIVEVEWAQTRISVLVADFDRQEVDLPEMKMEALKTGVREFGVQFGQS
jgi:hypothetical protein